jgi:hypothetical protein
MFAIGKLAAPSLPVVDLWNTDDFVASKMCCPTHSPPIVLRHAFGRPPIVPPQDKDKQASAKKKI